ncbi:hypothetical protein GH811_16845 [Acetobacterium malicum]|uniref:Uncharacterized protein n=1 Tax=Acetobacterium malicum TaxID=52692 RepID=A0ABR6Z184_9FIRM|nr:hypothetical protein [Acetobacterium malicum]MBC3901280.1 hypothetical protein [Acetobacterium malicum]
MLNSAQVRELFEKEAILFGDRDGVTIGRAMELFGTNATKFANDHSRGWANGFGIGDYTAHYLTFAGFQRAASYANVEEIKKETKNMKEKME